MSSSDQQNTVTKSYEQQLSRAIGVLGNIAITVSGITPQPQSLLSLQSPMPTRGVVLSWPLSLALSSGLVWRCATENSAPCSLS